MAVLLFAEQYSHSILSPKDKAAHYPNVILLIQSWENKNKKQTSMKKKEDVWRTAILL